MSQQHGMVPFLSVAAQSLMSLASLLLDPKFGKFRIRSAITLYLAILIVGSIPGARAEAAQVASGFLLHFSAYSCIAYLLFTGLDTHTRMRAVRTLLIVAAMGALDEFVQSFLPYRTAAIGDWCVDVSAAVFVSATLSVLWPRIPRTRTRA